MHSIYDSNSRTQTEPYSPDTSPLIGPRLITIGEEPPYEETASSQCSFEFEFGFGKNRQRSDDSNISLNMNRNQNPNFTCSLPSLYNFEGVLVGRNEECKLSIEVEWFQGGVWKEIIAVLSHLNLYLLEFDYENYYTINLSSIFLLRISPSRESLLIHTKSDNVLIRAPSNLMEPLLSSIESVYYSEHGKYLLACTDTNTDTDTGQTDEIEPSLLASKRMVTADMALAHSHDLERIRALTINTGYIGENPLHLIATKRQISAKKAYRCCLLVTNKALYTLTLDLEFKMRMAFSELQRVVYCGDEIWKFEVEGVEVRFWLEREQVDGILKAVGREGVRVEVGEGDGGSGYYE